MCPSPACLPIKPSKISGGAGETAERDCACARQARQFVVVVSGEVWDSEAADPQAAEKVAAIQFELDEFQRRRLLLREIG